MGKLSDKISDSELEVMRVLWEAQEALPLTAIRQTLRERMGWEDSTIKTLLARLHKKGVVAQEKRGVYYYTALVEEAEYNASTTQALIDRLFAGSARELVASLVSNRQLTPQDIEELRALLQGNEDEHDAP